MPMTPDEYAEKELNVPGYIEGALFPPDSVDPNIYKVLAANAAKQQSEQQSEPDPGTADIVFEYNFTLPLEQRRAEIDSEKAKASHINAKAAFWDALASVIEKLVR